MGKGGVRGLTYLASSGVVAQCTKTGAGDDTTDGIVGDEDDGSFGGVPGAWSLTPAKLGETLGRGVDGCL